MPPGCRPRGVSPQGRRRHMPRADPVHKEPTPHQATAAALMAQQLGQSQPPGVPIGDHPEAAPSGGGDTSNRAPAQPPPMPQQR